MCRLAALGLVAVLAISGCSSAGYYKQALEGHLDLMSRREPIAMLLQREDLEPTLRQQLQLALQARDFASEHLGLPRNDSYRSYADLGRPYAIWNVVAVPELSLQPQSWCFVFVGCLSYRGYFDPAAAQAFASELSQRGFDVSVTGARAYSTLGWFEDPLLNTMIVRGEASVVGLIVHELAHQQLYIDDDSMFNESFATAVEREGVRRWFERKDDAEGYRSYLASKARNDAFHALLANARSQLQTLYASTLSDDEKRQRKPRVFAAMRQDYEQLKQDWGGYTGYDAWMGRELNNAHLALAATYNALVPGFSALIAANGDDLSAFYRAAATLAELPKAERQAALERYRLGTAAQAAVSAPASN